MSISDTGETGQAEDEEVDTRRGCVSSKVALNTCSALVELSGVKSPRPDPDPITLDVVSVQINKSQVSANHHNICLLYIIYARVFV